MSLWGQCLKEFRCDDLKQLIESKAHLKTFEKLYLKKYSDPEMRRLLAENIAYCKNEIKELNERCYGKNSSNSKSIHWRLGKNKESGN